MNNLPENVSPRWVQKLLRWFLDSRTSEASLGDLEEKFQYRLRGDVPRWRAKLLFVLEALGFLKMARLPRMASLQATWNMIGHTFLFFGRLVKKDRSYYLVSLLGLTLSLASFMFSMMFIYDELSYDRIHHKKDRLYRLTTHLKLNDVTYDLATSQFPAAAAVQSDVPGVEHTIRVFPQDIEVTHGEEKFEEHILMVDPHFEEVFSFPWRSGDPKTALTAPASIVMTASMAKKYFGQDDPMGKTVEAFGQPFTVTGVLADVPQQSHLQFEALMPLLFQLNQWKEETGIEGRENKWFWVGAYTYVLLKDKAMTSQAEAGLTAVIEKYFPDRYKQHGAFHLQPVGDIHLTSGLSNEMRAGGSMLYVQLFAVVALIILIVSAINLINLSGFKTGSRMREVGIRKFLGQHAVRIVVQLSMESALIGMLSFILALIVCRVLLSEFNLLVQKDLSLISKPAIMIEGVTFVIIITICLLSIVRPAIRYAARPSAWLLLQKTGGPSHAADRNILIGLQVCFSFVLLAFSFIVSSQIEFFKHKDLGFDKENILLVEMDEQLAGHGDAFREELKTSNAIVDVSIGVAPGDPHNGWRFVPEDGSQEKPFLFLLAWVDHEYLKTLGIKLLAGEGFRPAATYEKDTLWPFLINKRAALELGWAGDPVNKRMKVFAAGTTDIMAEGRVVGLIDDYHLESLHKPVMPVVLTVSPGEYGTALVRTSRHATGEAIAHLERTWGKFSDKPLVYEPLERKLDKLYTNEVQLSNLIRFFTFIALYLTCYGMFAMSALLFSSRLKEVTIRKVFGAGLWSIISRFYSRYAVFNLLAILAGVPIVIYVGDLWLQTFQYRIDLTSSFFIKAGVCTLVVGLLSVTYYLLRVALSNPVKFLRNE